jgi:hypothetical protein
MTAASLEGLIQFHHDSKISSRPNRLEYNDGDGRSKKSFSVVELERKRAMIDQLKTEYPIQVIGDVICHSRSRYYYQSDNNKKEKEAELFFSRFIHLDLGFTARWIVVSFSIALI